MQQCVGAQGGVRSRLGSDAPPCTGFSLTSTIEATDTGGSELAVFYFCDGRPFQRYVHGVLYARARYRVVKYRWCFDGRLIQLGGLTDPDSCTGDLDHVTGDLDCVAWNAGMLG